MILLFPLVSSFFFFFNITMDLGQFTCISTDRINPEVNNHVNL